MQKENFNQFDLHGKTALITGGHSWLGFDMACALAEAGCDIVLAARSAEKLDAAAEMLRTGFGVEVLTIPTDQCIYDQVEVMAEWAWEWKGRIDILINNAGGGSGAEELCSVSMMYGADGCIPGLANFLPELFVKLYQACKKEDIEESYRLQEQINAARKCIFVNGCWVSGMKGLLELFRLGEPYVSSPLQILTSSQKEEMHRILKECGIAV